MCVPPRVVVALVGVLTVAALGGCGGGNADEPRPLPPFTPSPTSPAATATPSTTPSASADLERSAEDFVRAYMRELEDAHHTSRVAVLQRNFYDPGCRPCQFDLKVINDLKRNGERIEGYETSLTSLDVTRMSGSRAIVTAIGHHEAGRIVRAEDGSVVRRLPETKPVESDIVLARSGDGWRIIDILPLGEVGR